MTPAERNRAEASQTIRALYRHLAEIHSHVVGWELVALALAECASEALAHAADGERPDQTGLGR